ncbi:hypothetical protein [Streptomyces caniscabiei]|uniref:hypothetical protein n=1 Tax=Streptomyces caniscabiei TaxID=2746961 RepID=UPI0029A531D2|nr:hypothetical protein [Streptomyces caniscabiei]MDX3730876.1 hypothetical protein [Streptomyces caniscabiei]
MLFVAAVPTGLMLRHLRLDGPRPGTRTQRTEFGGRQGARDHVAKLSTRCPEGSTPMLPSAGTGPPPAPCRSAISRLPR